MVRTPCRDENKVKKGKWSQEEDAKLIDYVTKYGYQNWRQLPKHAGLARCGKSCRLRWVNYLRPNLKKGNYSKEEEATIVRLHERLGNRWSAIANHLPGRTDNGVKNHWHTHLKKQLKQNSDVQCEAKTLPNSDAQDKDVNKLNMECIHATKENPSAPYIFESSPVSMQSTSEFIGSLNGLAADEASAGIDHISFWSEPFLTDEFEMLPPMDPAIIYTQMQSPLFDTGLLLSAAVYPSFEEFN